jgi:hypothetical protein
MALYELCLTVWSCVHHKGSQDTILMSSLRHELQVRVHLHFWGATPRLPSNEMLCACLLRVSFMTPEMGEWHKYPYQQSRDNP